MHPRDRPHPPRLPCSRLLDLDAVAGGELGEPVVVALPDRAQPPGAVAPVDLGQQHRALGRRGVEGGGRGGDEVAVDGQGDRAEVAERAAARERRRDDDLGVLLLDEREVDADALLAVAVDRERDGAVLG